jgi:hypothetical protein
MWNLMQNYQDSNSQNSQFITLPANSNMFYRPQMDTQGVEFPRYETQPPIGSIQSVKFHNFQLKLVLKILRLKREKNFPLRKKLESYSQEKRIYFLLNRGSAFRRIQL